MASPVIQNNFRVRKTFAKITKIIDIPNLIDIQKHSYEKFLQTDIAAREARGRRPSGRLQERLPDQGLQRDDARSSSSRYHLEKPKYDVDECHQRGMTFAAPIKVVVRLVVWDKDEETGAAVDPRRQGAGGLLRRNSAHDRQRHLHHQRHRARRRQPAAPLAGRLLRSRQGQEPLVGQAALHRPHHPVPRLVARLRVRPQGHPLRPHRPPPQAARDVLAARARADSDTRRCSTTSTTPRRSTSSRARQVRQVGRARPAPRPARRRATSSTRRPAKSSSRRTASSPRRRSRSCKDAEHQDACRSTLDGARRQGRRRRRHRREDRRSAARVQRGGHRGEARRAARAAASTSSRSSSSTTSTSARSCATR